MRCGEDTDSREALKGSSVVEWMKNAPERSREIKNRPDEERRLRPAKFRRLKASRVTWPHH
jgi:hypothetical protein